MYKSRGSEKSLSFFIADFEKRPAHNQGTPTSTTPYARGEATPKSFG